MTTSEIWADNLGEELAFWRGALTDPGPDGDMQRQRATPRAVWDELRRRVPPGHDPVRMLDVGSGPLTTLGTLWPGRDVEVVAVDPLAEAYNMLLDELAIEPPVRTVPIRGEELLEHLAPSSFDVVHAANSLDHTADPIETLRQMLAVTRAGGTICLLHHVDVGELEHYHGLHQWNLRPEGRHDMLVWSRRERILLSELAKDSDAPVEVDIEEVEDRIFRAWIHLSERDETPATAGVSVQSG